MDEPMTRIIQVEWWPVYLPDQDETLAALTVEDQADYAATMQAFDRWQDRLREIYEENEGRG
jgi:hypothetical protein